MNTMIKTEITEDDIEQAILGKLKEEPFKYDILICDIDPNKLNHLCLHEVTICDFTKLRGSLFPVSS